MKLSTSTVLYLDGIRRFPWAALSGAEQYRVLTQYRRRLWSYEREMRRAEAMLDAKQLKKEANS